MRTAKQMRASRLYHLELIALGMALAQSGDRDKILEAIDPDSIQSEIVSSGLRAIQSKDPADIRVMRKAFEQIGLSVEESVIDAVIENINLRNAQRRLEECLSELASASGNDQIQEAVQRTGRSWESLASLTCNTGEAK